MTSLLRRSALMKTVVAAAVAMTVCAPCASAQNTPQNCGDLPTGSEQKQCAETQFRSSEAELARMYTRSMDLASKVEAQRPHPLGSDASSWSAAIAASHVAWLAYRNAECNGVVGRGDGSGRMFWIFGCLTEKNQQRIRELDVPFFQR